MRRVSAGELFWRRCLVGVSVYSKVETGTARELLVTTGRLWCPIRKVINQDQTLSMPFSSMQLQRAMPVGSASMWWLLCEARDIGEKSQCDVMHRRNNSARAISCLIVLETGQSQTASDGLLRCVGCDAETLRSVVGL